MLVWSDAYVWVEHMDNTAEMGDTGGSDLVGNRCLDHAPAERHVLPEIRRISLGLHRHKADSPTLAFQLPHRLQDTWVLDSNRHQVATLSPPPPSSTKNG
jgi:hypothetical protein